MKNAPGFGKYVLGFLAGILFVIGCPDTDGMLESSSGTSSSGGTFGASSSGGTLLDVSSAEAGGTPSVDCGAWEVQMLPAFNAFESVTELPAGWEPYGGIGAAVLLRRCAN